MPGLRDDGVSTPLIRPTMPELDSLRGIAVLLVLTFHAFDYSQATTSEAGWFSIIPSFGWMGVNLFFVLSGFLITGILLDSRLRPDYFRRFYIRRALRILPLYYAVLFLLYPLSHSGLLGQRRVGWPFLAMSSVYLSNVVGLFGIASQYTVLWSLAVEEQFYIAWPAVIRFLSRRGVMFAALAMMLGCPLLRGLAFKFGYNYSVGYTWLVADELAFGALLGLLSRGWLAERKLMLRCSILCLALGAGLLGLGAPFGILLNRTFLGGSLRITALNFLFTGTLAAFLVVGSSRFKWIVRRPVLQFFGEISYGLYLVHMLVFDMFDHFTARYLPGLGQVVPNNPALLSLRFVIASGLAVLVAFLSRRYFEAYFLRMKERWNQPLEQPEEARAMAAFEC